MESLVIAGIALGGTPWNGETAAYGPAGWRPRGTPQPSAKEKAPAILDGSWSPPAVKKVD